MKIRIFKLFDVDCSNKEWLSKHLICGDFGRICFSPFEITNENVRNGLVRSYMFCIGKRI